MEDSQGAFKGFLARLFSISSYEIASPRGVSIFISSGEERTATTARGDEGREECTISYSGDTGAMVHPARSRIPIVETCVVSLRISSQIIRT